MFTIGPANYGPPRNINMYDEYYSVLLTIAAGDSKIITKLLLLCALACTICEHE